MRGGYIRLFTACFLCFMVAFYQLSGILSPPAFVKAQNSELSEYFPDDSLAFAEFKTESQTSFAQQSSSKESQASQEKSETASNEVSATAVKGKVISRYISPYNASLNYDSAYIKNNTPLFVNLQNYFSSKINISFTNSDKPQVLIMHTHTTESFMENDDDFYSEDYKSRNTDNEKNMVAVGKIIAKKLNDAGIATIHDTTQHDYPEYTGSYSRAAKTVCSYLEKYPSIKVVLDLHRDAVSSGENDKVKLVTEINGKKAAQVMLVMGSQSGTVTNFPNWEENFKLALRLQQTMEKKYPTLARPLMLMSKNYNQSLCNGSLLIEFGTDANCFSEVFYSAEMVGDSLVELFNALKK